MKPVFQVIANSQDITDLLRDRLISIRTTDKPGIESDECELHVDDRDGMVVFPGKGALLEISLGFDGRPLQFIGKYKVDEIEISGPPQSMVIRGKPANFIATMKGQKRHGWEDVSLHVIVGDIASRNKLQPLCLVSDHVPRADQINESDMHFITRLARQHGATATVKDGKLIVAPRGAGKGGSGRPLPAIKLHRDDLASYSLTFPDRPLYAEIETQWHDSNSGARMKVIEPNDDGGGASGIKHADRHVYPNADEAKAAAKSRKEALNRATASGRLDLMRGRGDIGAEQWLELNGVKTEADGTYLIESVEQNYSKSAWVTSVTISAGNGGKGKVGRGKTPAGSTKIINPD